MYCAKKSKPRCYALSVQIFDLHPINTTKKRISYNNGNVAGIEMH